MPAPVAVPARWEFEAIGTRWRIDTAAPLGAAARSEVTGVLDRFDREWSRFRDDSLVCSLASGGSAAAPPDAEAMLGLYLELTEATGGAVNPLIGGSLVRRGYDADLSLIDRGAEPAPVRWSRLLTWTDGLLVLRRPALIDVGALGKGRLVDLVAAALTSMTEGPFVVDASGDLFVRGGGEAIGLEHPYDPAKAIGIWHLAEGALCASAVNRRSWPGADGTGLHHVLDARTGQPVRTVAATWAVGADAMTADAAATALFFAGGERFAADRDAQWVRMSTDGRVEWSRGCTAELFL